MNSTMSPIEPNNHTKHPKPAIPHPVLCNCFMSMALSRYRGPALLHVKEIPAPVL